MNNMKKKINGNERENMNVLFAEKNFNNYKTLKEDVDIYKKYLQKDARILEIGYNCTKIIEVAAENGKKIGKDNEFKLLNIFEMDQEYKKDSFDACISSGILEHFSRDQIRDIIDMQLSIAPIVIASFPVRTKRTLRHYNVKNVRGKEVCCDKIHRNLCSEYQWKEQILEFYDITESYIKKCSSLIGNFDEMVVVIERDYSGEEFNGVVDESDKENRMAQLFTGSYGWDEELSAFELYFMNCFDFPFKAKFRSNEYGDKKTIFTVIRTTCCRDKGGVFCEIRLDDGTRREVPVYSIIPLDKKHRRNIAIEDYIKWLPFKIKEEQNDD